MNELNIITAPDVLLPAHHIDLEKWAVIACDQFTQEPDYWEQVDRYVGERPSTLRLIFPEVYLDAHGKRQRIENIRQAMTAYLETGVFTPPRHAFIYVERSTPFSTRRGLIANIDLEQYDWKNPQNARIRATEETLPERLPPRMDIRRGAPLETPHILLLINDKKDAFLPALGVSVKKNPPLYHTNLMTEAGSITGWAVDDENALKDGITRLLYEGKDFVFAVGDGNHSLATAKAVWEEYKNAHAGDPSLDRHPARYALVEIENLYDKGVRFEPIHRVLFGEKTNALLDALSALPDFSCAKAADVGALSRLVAQEYPKNRAGVALENDFYLIEFANTGLAPALIQPLLDVFMKESGCVADYVHGEEALFKKARNKAGILLPPFQKSGLFETVANIGALPRKSFSMGHALEKRFYFECRKIF
jgi:uncharacterized protein (DUF1015 family)